MLKRFAPFVFFVVSLAAALAFAAESPAAPVSSVPAKADTATTREVPVRYWIIGDSVEQEAIFVKIEKDTVYLRALDESTKKIFEEINEQEAVALQESNGQKVEEEDEFEDDDKAEPAKPAEIIMTDAVKDSLAAKSDSAAAADSIAAAEAAKAAEIAADAEDDLALGVHGAGGVVGGHEEGAQQQAAAHQLIGRIGEVAF